jgi:hypothetical protein
MAAQYILAVLAAVFLLATLIRLARDSGRIGPASRTWLIVAIIFAVVSAWLWTGGHR